MASESYPNSVRIARVCSPSAGTSSMRASDNPGGSKTGISPTGAASSAAGPEVARDAEVAHLIYAGVGELRVIETHNRLLRREITRAADTIGSGRHCPIARVLQSADIESRGESISVTPAGRGRPSAGFILCTLRDSGGNFLPQLHPARPYKGKRDEDARSSLHFGRHILRDSDDNCLRLSHRVPAYLHKRGATFRTDSGLLRQTLRHFAPPLVSTCQGAPHKSCPR